jgi:hypothetical protein
MLGVTRFIISLFFLCLTSYFSGLYWNNSKRLISYLVLLGFLVILSFPAALMTVIAAAIPRWPGVLASLKASVLLALFHVFPALIWITLYFPVSHEVVELIPIGHTSPLPLTIVLWLLRVWLLLLVIWQVHPTRRMRPAELLPNASDKRTWPWRLAINLPFWLACAATFAFFLGLYAMKGL